MYVLLSVGIINRSAFVLNWWIMGQKESMVNMIGVNKNKHTNLCSNLNLLKVFYRICLHKQCLMFRKATKMFVVLARNTLASNYLTFCLNNDISVYFTSHIFTLISFLSLIDTFRV